MGRHLVFWPDFCSTWAGCSGASAPRVLAVTGTADAGREQVLQVMETIVMALRPVTNSVPPPKQPQAGTRLERVLALDAAGKLIGGEERPHGDGRLCRAR